MQPGLARRILQFPVTRILIAFLSVSIVMLVVPMSMDLLGALLGVGSAGWFQVLSALLAVTAVYFVYRLYVRVIERRDATELALDGALPELGAGVLVGALLFTTVILILAVMGIYQFNGLNPTPQVLTVLALSISSGFIEEVLFRGILFRIVQESLGTWLALLISAAFFGLAHFANPGATVFSSLAIALEAGFLLGGAYLLTRRLWLAVGIHFAWNFTQGGIFGVAISGHPMQGLFTGSLTGPEILSGGSFGAEASAVALVVCLVSFGVLYWQARKREHVIAPFWARKKVEPQTAQA